MARLTKVLLLVIFSLSFCVTAGAVKLPPGPLWHVSHTDKVWWSCLLGQESTSTFTHINTGDTRTNGGPSGPFQITQTTFAAHQLEVRIPLSVHVWQASLSQQERVAFVIQRDDTWQPWRGDGCAYP